MILDRKTLTLNQTSKFETCPNSKHFADDNLNVAKMAKFIFDVVENIVRKGKKNAGYHSIFAFFHNVFKRLLSHRR